MEIKDLEKTKILFDANSHTYTDELGNEYRSATTFIGDFKPKFNKYYWSMYVALRDNGFRVRPDDLQKGIFIDGSYRDIDDLYRNPIHCNEVDLVVNQWKHITKKACDRGNKIHNYLEDSINESKGDIKGESNKEVKPITTEVAPPFSVFGGEDVIIRTKHDLDVTTIGFNYPDVYNYLLLLINNGFILYAEKRVFSVMHLIAGTIDVLAIKGNMFIIVDWKTNKDEMIFESGYFKKKRINGKYVKTTEWVRKLEYFKSPLDNVEHCKGMLYSLQLSLYARIMEMWGYRLVNKGLGIWHFRPRRLPKYIRIPYLREEIDAALEYRYKTINGIVEDTVNNFGIR